MTEEVMTLAGKWSEDDFKLLRWKDLIEFCERFGTGLESLEDLPPAKRIEAVAWLDWRIHTRKTGEQISFEEWLERPALGFFQQA
jgi:hypothetical protein